MTWNNKTYIFYSVFGLGDVFEIEGGDPARQATDTTPAPPSTGSSRPGAVMSFWIMFDGTQTITAGQVLQPGAATFATQITFTPGIYTMFATFTGRGWTITDVQA